MNIYHLPGSGIYGGIKAGYQFAALLRDLGAPTIATTPDGRAPQWFRTAVPTVSHAEARALVTPGTNILFSYPPDYPDLLGWGGRMVNHCQGTDDRMDPIFANPEVTILTCWPQAQAHVLRLAGRATVDVGIPVTDVFFYDATAKVAGTVAFMPRRGGAIAKAAARRCRHLDFTPIDGADEAAVAGIMKASEYYLATSVGEMFGLPAIEAMAAGCVVVSVPVVGGMDYLHDGENCVIAGPGEIPDALLRLSRPGNAALRARLRAAACETALAFLESRQHRHVAALLGGELAFLRSAPTAGPLRPPVSRAG